MMRRGAMLQADRLLPEDAGPSCSSRRVDLDGVALPVADTLVVVTADGTVLALDAAGRRLWEALKAGCTVDDLVEAGVVHGGLSLDLARANVASALDSWRALGLIDAPGPAVPAMPVGTLAPTRNGERTPALDAVYLVGDLPVRVRCGDVVLGRVVDAACGSHRVEDDDGAAACIEVLVQDKAFAVRADNAFLTSNNELTPNRALARHRCLTALLETARPRRKWLGILHASVVSAGGGCLAFIGASGSGKSTLAAALVAAGADFVTDDYAPLEQGTWHVWPVPYAPGIKRGSWRRLRQYYPEIYERPVHRLAGMHIRYLALEAANMAPIDRGLPVAALVFPSYQAGAAFEQCRITAAEAFAEICHARSILDRRPDVLAETLRWIASQPAYRITYGDLDRARDWVLSLSAVE